MKGTGDINIFLSEEDLLEGGQVDIPSSQLFALSVPKAFSGTFKREKSNGEVACSDVTLPAALFLYFPKWLFSDVFLANYTQYPTT